MWRSKKFIVGAVLVAVLLFGSLGGIVLADNGDGGPAAKLGEFINNVIDKYEDETGDEILYPDKLIEAFADARADMCKARAEMRAATMENGPQNLTDEQKEALQEWWDSRPEDVPMKFGFGGHGGFRGFGGMRGFGGHLFTPAE